MKFCLVCSCGGHVLQLHSLNKLWAEHQRFWVTFPAEDSKYLLRDETIHWAHFPTNRNIKNLIKNLFLAWRLLRKERPDVIITTGAGVAVPFIYIGAMLGIRTIFVESLTRTEGVSLSAKLVYPVVKHLLVQWPELAEKYKKARFEGQVL